MLITLFKKIDFNVITLKKVQRDYYFLSANVEMLEN